MLGRVEAILGAGKSRPDAEGQAGQESLRRRKRGNGSFSVMLDAERERQREAEQEKAFSPLLLGVPGTEGKHKAEGIRGEE